jgi:phage shock protein C
MTQSTVGYRKLRRPLDDRMVAGVCSGLARYFGVDPVLVRIGFAVLALVTWGVALVAYPLLWIIMPDADPAEQPWRDPADPTWGRPHQPE